MLGLATRALAATGLSQRLAEKVAPWVLAFAFALLAAACVAIWDHFDDAAAIERDRLEGNVEQLEKQLAADAAAAEQRLNDDHAQQDQQEAYDDAINSPKPTDDGDPDVRLACEQLRQAGKDTSRLAPCGGY